MTRTPNKEKAEDARKKVQGSSSVLQEGDTCWRIAKANRVAFLVDAADYFAAAKAAMLKAERSICLVGWEFDLNIRLRPSEAEPDSPDELRPFLHYLAKRRPELEIFILQWDGAMIVNIARQLAPFLLLKAQTKPQIHFRLDSRHPVDGCHHQKIVVIDDVLAFCGGIDMTAGRWDTAKHTPADQRRLTHGQIPMPWHDVTMAVDGEAAKALGELARWRWKRATGSDLPVPDRKNDVWPDDLPSDCEDVSVGIARTLPDFEEETAVSEVERLWLRAIASARRTIYIENQFLSSGAIAEALKQRLEEKGGPEIVLVLPFSAESWLESEVMDTARSLLIGDLRSAGEAERFGVYRPINAAGEHVYVHAKVLIVDDDFVRVGSSNMSGRSLCLDTECDLGMEAKGKATRSAIAALRNKLMAEHLGTSCEKVAAALEENGGSVLRTIEALRTPEGPTLCHLQLRTLNETELALAKSRLLDPEGRRPPSKRLKDFLIRSARHQQIPLTIAGTLLVGWAAQQITRKLTSQT